VNYYLLAQDVWRLSTLCWYAQTSMLKTLAAKHKSSVAKMAARYKAKAITGHDPRTQLAVEPLELPQPGPLRYLQRRLLFCMLFPVSPDPAAERRLVDPQLPRYIRYGTRGFYHHPGCFFPELW